MVATDRRERVSVWSVLTASASAWRRQVAYLTLLGALVLAPVVLAELVLARVSGHLPGTDEGVTIDLNLLPAVLAGMLAHHFLTGVMESIESSARHGHPRPTLGQLARSLPWVRLVAANVLVNVAVAVGLALLVVPGLAVAVYAAVAFPLLNLERRPVRATLRRSARLVRGHEATVLGVLAVVHLGANAVKEAVGEGVEALTHSQGGEFVGHLAAEVVVLPLASLPVVILALALVAAEPADG